MREREQEKVTWIDWRESVEKEREEREKKSEGERARESDRERLLRYC